MFNLAAPFVIQFFWDKLLEVLKYVDVVFCNDSEAVVAGKKNEWGVSISFFLLCFVLCDNSFFILVFFFFLSQEDLEVIAEKLAKLPLAKGKSSRIAVITAGPEKTIVYFNGKIHKFAPIKLEDKDIVDTNGAGDSFTGGFISQYIYHGLDKDLTEETLKRCIDAAHYTASKAISVVGCKFEGKPEFK